MTRVRWSPVTVVVAAGWMTTALGATATRGGVPPNPAPHCYQNAYATVKTASASYPGAPRGRAEDDVKSNDSQIIRRPAPLEEPPEIARIRRGWVSHYVGAFINDGLESWEGIDLDRSLAVSVERHIYDRRSALTKPLRNPRFPPHPVGFEFARKYVGPGRAELEVIATIEVDDAAIEAFVCAANAAWAAPAAKPVYLTDTLVSTDALLDEQLVGSATMAFSKRVNGGGAVGATIGWAMRYLPKVNW